MENSKILSINGGSSSIKFALYELNNDHKEILSGKIDRIGFSDAELHISYNDKKTSQQITAQYFKEAVVFLISWIEKQIWIKDVKCIGHRIVHGMQHTHAELIGDELLDELKQISAYDPEHLPAEIEMIEMFRKQFPSLLQVACFDTSFHTTLPRIAKILPIPRRFDNAGIQRYGFHGLSYTYLMEVLKNKKGEAVSNQRIILAHLGNGASMAAVKEGKCIDTTMGFTPAGGMVMGSRCGDIDPGAAWYMIQSEQLTATEFSKVINHNSGLLGVSEISADMQDLLAKENSDIRAAEAVGLFCYQAKKWIGAFTAALNGLDTLVFSGGIGENAAIIRTRICAGLEYLGVELDEVQNNRNAFEISTAKSNVKVYVIPTNEELMIAKIASVIYNEPK